MPHQSGSNREFFSAHVELSKPGYRVTLTWEQATRFIYQREGLQDNYLSGQERLKIAAAEMGYEVKIADLDENGRILPTVILWRDGVNSHTFFLDDNISLALQFLRAELIYNGSYYPDEEKDWSVEGLKALCPNVEDLQCYPLRT